MSRIFESIRSQIEDVLFQWNQKENEYLASIQQLKEDNNELVVVIADLKQELEFIQKQFDESQSKEKTLQFELEKLKTDQAMFKSNTKANKKWRFFL
jgi:chromosome segregation ATPase